MYFVDIDRREAAILALGGYKAVEDNLFIRKEEILSWVEGKNSNLGWLETHLRRRQRLHQRAEMLGGVAEGFSLVWPAYKARCDPALVDSQHHTLKIDQEDDKFVPLSYEADVEVTLALARHLAMNDPAKAKELICAAPALVQYLLRHQDGIVYRYKMQRLMAEKAIEECDATLAAHEVLIQKILPEIEW